jgi:hypothetical protein
MPSIVDTLIATHPDGPFVYATTKPEVLATLDAIRRTIEAMPDFERFPEGSIGAVLYATLRHASTACPDPGDLNQVHQGCQAALSTAFRVISEDIDWFPSRNRPAD